MRPVGFAPAIWVNMALAQGLFPTARSFAVASALARAVDADGRWCFKHLSTLASSSGRMLSKRTVQRGIEDLIRAKIVRKLDDPQTQTFFWRTIASGWRSAEHMPCVLELCIPARDFPDAQLEQINRVRRELGEEPLEETTRPRLYPAPEKERCAPAKKAPAPRTNCTNQDADTPTPSSTESSISTTESEESGHFDQTPWSSWPPDLSPTDFFSTGAGTSVRGTSTTGRRAHALIARIPNALLNNPAGDRDLLGRAVEALAEHGMDEQQLTALLSGAEQLRKPFPGLMSRLSSPQRALAFLEGQLGRGVNSSWPHGPTRGPQPPARPWPEYEQEAEFVLDAHGRAARTCPDHPGVRNPPGGTCSVCARPCRTDPGHEPPEPAPPQPEEACPETEPEPASETDGDPELARRMLQSLEQAGKAEPTAPAADQAPPRNPPARQATIDALRRRLSPPQQAPHPEPEPPTASPPPARPAPPGARDRTPLPGTSPPRTGMPLPGPAPTGAHAVQDPRPHLQEAPMSTLTTRTGTPHVPAPRLGRTGNNTRATTPMTAKAATVAGASLLTIALAPAAPVSAAQDTYADYAELAANESEGTDYRRTTRQGETDVAHIAIHGGGIERPTTELADHAAQEGEHAFATFEGIKPTGNSILHITSTNFDEPMTLEVVADAEHTLSWHGAAGEDSTTYVGGLDTDLRERVREELRAAGFDAPEQIPDGLKGESPDNITNRNARGEGVQLELTRAQRDAFTDQDGSPTEAFHDYTAAVERAVDQR